MLCSRVRILNKVLFLLDNCLSEWSLKPKLQCTVSSEINDLCLFSMCACHQRHFNTRDVNQIFNQSNCLSRKCWKRKLLKKKTTRKHPGGCSRNGRAAKNSACNFLQHKTFSMGENMLAAGDVARFYSGHRRYLFEHQKLWSRMRKVDKMQKRGKHISKYFERPEGTQEDVAETDGLRKTQPAASFSIKHFLWEKTCLLQAT